MTDDLHSFARRIDALDEIIANANADKAQVYQEAKRALRDDLPAFRDAMATRRKRDKNPAAYQELKGRAAELLDALDNGVVLEHARARARTSRKIRLGPIDTTPLSPFPSPAGGVSSAGPSQAVEPRSPGPIPAGVPKPDDGDGIRPATPGEVAKMAERAFTLEKLAAKLPSSDDNPMPAHLRHGSAARAAAIAAGGGK